MPGLIGPKLKGRTPNRSKEGTEGTEKGLMDCTL